MSEEFPSKKNGGVKGDLGVRTMVDYGDGGVAQATAIYRMAQADYYAAQAKGQDIDNITAQALADSAKIALRREQLKDEWDASANGRNRVYQFTGDVKEETVEPTLDILGRWSRMDRDNQDPWRFSICSSGGNVVFGMKLYSTLRSIAETRPLIVIASGMCASMATVIHQAGTERLIEPGTSYLLHDVSGATEGTLASMQDTMGWLKKINSRLHEALAEKSNLDVQAIGELCERRDSWLMAEEVVEKGFADRIGFTNQ